MIDTRHVQNIVGSTVYDSAGEKVGKVAQVYLSNRDDQVEWLTVHTGLFGMRENFVPAQDATFADDEVRVSATKDQIKNAPQIDADAELVGGEERELYQYYGLDHRDTDSVPTGTNQSGVGHTDTRSTVESDVSDRGTDQAMTRSKEELQVGTQETEAGRVRLRKYVTTEQETVTVPVKREEVRLEREPITDANRDEALSGRDISEDEHEVILHKEEPVVGKTTTPVERVRLEKQEVTEERQVTGEVREEHFDVDADGTTEVTEDDRRRR